MEVKDPPFSDFSYIKCKTHSLIPPSQRTYMTTSSFVSLYLIDPVLEFFFLRP